MRLVRSSLVLAIFASGCGGSVVQDSPLPPSGDAGDAETIVDTAPPPPQTLTINEIAVLQGVKVTIARDGAKVGTVARVAPVVYGRAGLIRVYTTQGPGWLRKGVAAELTLSSVSRGAPIVLKAIRDMRAYASTDTDLESTFNFELAEDALRSDTKYSLVIKTTPSSAPLELAHYPEGDPERIEAQKSSELQVKIVPIRWGFDASSRLPDISADALEGYRATMMALYPATKVTVTVRDPFDWKEQATADGTGWDDLLMAIVKLRADDLAPNDVYYYGAFQPASSFFKYCKGGCVAGLSGLVSDPFDATGRGSIGLGYGDEESWSTMAHEIGHAHGRAHAPCGPVERADKFYPYDGGAIGVIGYDVANKQVIDSSITDIMGYCWPKWISDYNYGKLYQRMAAVAASPSITFPDKSSSSAPQKYRFVSVRKDGTLAWGNSLTLAAPPLAEPHTITFTAEDGTITKVTGMYYPYADLPGGYMLVPEPTTRVVRANVSGISSGLDAVLGRIDKP